MTARESEIIGLIRKEVKPALGCTEPIAVALAVSKAMEVIEEQGGAESTDWRMGTGFRLDVKVSGNILKNGMGVGIPGTGMVGLHIAAALGAVCGKSSYGLEVLNDLSEAAIGHAKGMLEVSSVSIGLAETDKKLYVRAEVKCDGHCSYAVIENDHDNIVETGFDGKVLSSSAGQSCDEPVDQKSTLDYNLTVKEILEFASNVAYDDIEFILESRTLNLALANEGLKGCYGLKVGYAISLDANREVFGTDFLSYAMTLTAAASDARMAGCTLAAMSNSGSGNQGITVTMPVIAYSLRYGCSDEQLARALVLSHLIAIHIKGYLGKLSALCGCVIASTGAACGLVYLRGGDYGQICAAIKNMIGNITGMVCDGAKVGCAMKVASGVSSALQSAVLAREGICISEHEGIIEKDIEKTIQNLGRIGSVGMQSTDNMILDIMVCK
ncbi:MAG: serine dehydratase subunit alpha family protein [Bacteroidales bacterium]|nr:serine dehydratase subunit alpha family protein [Bacteroidales bacterium]